MTKRGENKIKKGIEKDIKKKQRKTHRHKNIKKKRENLGKMI